MLRITTSRSTARAKSYFSTADYYSEGQELVGVWHGKGAARLGLHGEIRKDDWDLLSENRDPMTGGTLTARQRSERRVGFDFTFDVPKSVSVLYGFTGDTRILDAFRQAVDETMREIEADAATRVRTGNRNEDRATGNLLWGQYVHFTSRPVNGVPDPQLHAHNFVFNATFDRVEGKWKAVQLGPLKRDAPYYQAAMDSRLARGLNELGLATQRSRDGWELAGLSKASLEKFSLRTKQIEELAARKGITDAKAKAELGAKTREAKAATLSMSELRERWRKRLAPDEERTLALQQLAAGSAPIPERAGADREAVRLAILDKFERQSVMPERRLLAEGLKRAVGEASFEAVKRAQDQAGLINAHRDGSRLVTTREVLAEESRMLAFAREGRGTRPRISEDVPHFPAEKFNSEQKAAVMHVLRSRDAVILFRGAAGTGKSDTLKVARQAIEKAGHKIFAFAPSSGASRGELRAKGFASAETLAMLLKDQELQESVKGAVWWIDEAGMVGAKDMNALFALAKRQGARLVLAGDRRQHGPVARGEALRLLEEEAGLAPIELKEIVRQQGAYRDAVADLSEGRVAEGLTRLDRLGWIREIPGEERSDALAAAYVESVKTGKSALVIAPSKAEGAVVTASIREQLKAAGQLESDEREFAQLVPRDLTEAQRHDPLSYDAGDVLIFHQNAPGYRKGQHVEIGGEGRALKYAERFTVSRLSQLRLAKGDRIRITRNGFTKVGNHRLNNGDLFTVQGFAPNGDLLIGNGWQLQKDYLHFASGFVTTSYASQSKTVQHVFIAQSEQSWPASSQEQFYVSISRAREKAVVFTDSREDLLEAVSRSGERLSATELVAGREPGRRRVREQLIAPTPGAMQRTREREIEHER